jgi:F-type H+-transporting ATPase subunit delta
MKIRKEALRSARQMLRASMPDGRLDQSRARALVGRVMAEKPRNYIQILSAFQRLLKLEIEKRHAVIETAFPLPDAERDDILDRLKSRFGPDLTSEIRTNPDLVSGVRVKLGSTIWDGTIRARLDALRQSLGA